MRTKICTKCGLEKPTSEFNKNKLKKGCALATIKETKQTIEKHLN